MRKTPAFKTKICLRCGQEYVPTGATQKRCADCKPLAWKDYMRQWLSVRPGYKGVHQDYDANLARSRSYATTHQEAVAFCSQAYYATHKDGYAQRAARRRMLGFIPLNQSFNDSEPHHIDKEHVIYIPRKLHRSIPHNVFTGKNMDKINALALEYLRQETSPSI